MLRKDLIKLIKEQVGFELSAHNKYWCIASYFDAIGLVNFRDFFFKQAEEENLHAKKILNFLNEIDERLLFIEVPLSSINDPQSPVEAVTAAFEGEQFITKKINEIYSLAIEVKDPQISQFFLWFVEEQREEEEVMSTILKQVKLTKDITVIENSNFLNSLNTPEGNGN